MVIKTKDTLYLVEPNFYCLASYKGAYSNDQSLNFVIPIIVILFLGIIPGTRGVAQFGSALAWGASGRRFKSSRPDH